MKYSIIIPVYNVEKYISKCIDSIVNQTYKNIEIILVDDGSPDRSPEICDLYAKKDKRIKVIHKSNGGLVSARKAGIDIATGKYCLFVDSDDWIDECTIEKLNNYITEYGNVDLIKFRYVFEPKKNLQPEYTMCNHILDKDERNKVYRELLLTNNYNNLCNEVFKKELYDIDDKVLKMKINYGEDLIVNLKIFATAKNIVLINDAFYHYLLNDKSITHRVMIDSIAKNVSDNIYVNKEKIKYLKKYNIDIEKEEIVVKSVDFLYNQIKDYICYNKEHNFVELQDRINATDFYKFISKINVGYFKKCKFYEKRIKKYIINSEIPKTKKYVLFFKIRNKIKKIVIWINNFIKRSS